MKTYRAKCDHKLVTRIVAPLEGIQWGQQMVRLFIGKNNKYIVDMPGALFRRLFEPVKEMK